MTIEDQFIHKVFYETFLEEYKTEHPIQMLSELFLDEQNKELPDLTPIRYAQGELYYQLKDYEAAIFKWENVQNELEPWAKKNIGDSYYELGLLTKAEDIYHSIETNDLTLSTEVALKRFALYIEQEKHDLAVTMIKKAVELNPDYPNVTDLARTFFEQHSDWNNSVELALHEAIRTESLEWFDILGDYIDQGATKSHSPIYFSEALLSLFYLDQIRFERLISSLWKNFKNEDVFFEWLREINHLLLNIDVPQTNSWQGLSTLFQETYINMISGKYKIAEIEDVVPNLLTNWLKFTDSSHASLASAAVLAWNEVFPSSMEQTIVYEAENVILKSKHYSNSMDESLDLLEAMIHWSDNQQIEVGIKLKWMVDKLIDLETQNVIIAGESGTEQTSLIYSLLEDNIIGPLSNPAYFKNHDFVEINEITEKNIKNLYRSEDFNEDYASNPVLEDGDSLIEMKVPNPFLKENNIALVHAPKLSIANLKNNLNYLHFADYLLFVLDASKPFSESDKNMALKLRNMAPDLPIHFVINKMDTFYYQTEKIFEEVSLKVQEYFPNSKVFEYPSSNKQNKQFGVITELFKQNQYNNLEEKRTSKILFFIRELITSLLRKRVEFENSLIESINWNMDVQSKLNDAIKQLNVHETDKIRRVKSSFQSILEDIKDEFNEDIPKILRECSDVISEESDFGKIHLELNDEMNIRIQNYVNETGLPHLHHSIQEWIQNANEQLNLSDNFLSEMSESFNALYQKEKLQLLPDFKILDDWKRDCERMTSGVKLDPVNIMLRFKPSQLLLKGAGKLFGALSQNKAMLSNKYSQFIESENYEEVTKIITNNILLHFELFEKSIERDIALFFSNPHNFLKQTIEETKLEIQLSQEKLNEIRSNPDDFQDPLTLFKLSLRQYEWIAEAKKEFHPVY